VAIPRYSSVAKTPPELLQKWVRIRLNGGHVVNGRVLKLSEDSLQLLKGSNEEAPQQMVSLQEIRSISEVHAAA
jgi:hypothetical protein